MQCWLVDPALVDDDEAIPALARIIWNGTAQAFNFGRSSGPAGLVAVCAYASSGAEQAFRGLPDVRDIPARLLAGLALT